MNFTRTASQYYLRPDNFACGDIRRFVTIGTPFNGAVDADAWRTSQEGGAMQSSVLGWKPLATATDWIEGEEQRQKMVDDEGNPTRHTAALDLQRGSIAQQILDGAVPPLEGGSWTPASYPTNDRAVWWFPLVFRVALEGSDEAHPEASEFMSNTRRAIRWVSLPQADLDQVNAGNSDFVVTMNSQRNSNGNNDRNQNRGFVFHNHVHSRSRTSLGRVKNEMDSPEVPPFIEKKLRRDETEFYSDGLNE
jgi:hypothetical protein